MSWIGFYCSCIPGFKNLTLWKLICTDTKYENSTLILKFQFQNQSFVVMMNLHSWAQILETCFILLLLAYFPYFILLLFSQHWLLVINLIFERKIKLKKKNVSNKHFFQFKLMQVTYMPDELRLFWWRGNTWRPPI